MTYSDDDIEDKTDAIFMHFLPAYPAAPSPHYAQT